MSVFAIILVRIFPAFSRIQTPYLSIFTPNAGKCGKNAIQNNYEYRHFLRSVTNIGWAPVSAEGLSFQITY